MTFSLSQFKEKKLDTLEQLQNLRNLFVERKQVDYVRTTEKLIQDVMNEEFVIVVVGEFSRGKSTFINSFLGKRILPSSVKPTTTILNKITYKEYPNITLHYRDEKGKSRAISEEEFKKIVAPRDPIVGDEQSEKEYEEALKKISEVAYAEVGYPLSFCSDGVEIIDTPGTNDLDEAREEITNTFIPTSDAAILLLSGLKILSESEMSFLRDRILSQDIQKVFFVINFKDALDEAGIKKVYSYAQEKLSKVVDDPKIFFVSAKHALAYRRKQNGETIRMREPIMDIEETGIPQLEQELAQFLQYERGMIKLQKPIQTAKRLANKTLQEQITFDKKSLNNDIKDLDKKLEKLREQISELKRTGKEANNYIEITLKKEEKVIQGEYGKGLKKIATQARETANSLYKKMSTEEVVTNVETKVAPLERALHEKMKKIQEETLKEILTIASQKVEKHIQSIQGQLEHLVRGEMDHNIRSVKSDEKYSNYAPIDIVDDIVGSIWEQIPRGRWYSGVLKGLTLFTGVIGKGIQSIFHFFSGRDQEHEQLMKGIDERFDKNIPTKLNRFKDGWREKIKAVMNLYNQKIQEQVNILNMKMETLLQNRQVEQYVAEERLQVLNRQEQQVEHVIQEMNKIISDKVGVK
ncbi:dynamin family protein [Bacillus cereus group sp. BfR-BA-01445]|uniref:dynamin family protein n=1 Tax=Bacillus cereus group TaxID=86661 RepID=UPI001F5A8F4C|nr:dynamin family protein [Bacillus cereus group sp. BfR-BA-01445]